MTALLLIPAIILAALFAWALVRGGTQKPTPRPRSRYEMRYRGGDAPCVVCGRPSRGYTLHGRPIHPECRNLPPLVAGTALDLLNELRSDVQAGQREAS